MKLNTKQIIVIIIGVILIVSIGINIYFSLEKAKEISYKKGLNDGAINITNQIKNGARINYEDGIILFVPKQ